MPKLFGLFETRVEMQWHALSQKSKVAELVLLMWKTKNITSRFSPEIQLLRPLSAPMRSSAHRLRSACADSGRDFFYFIGTFTNDHLYVNKNMILKRAEKNLKECKIKCALFTGSFSKNPRIQYYHVCMIFSLACLITFLTNMVMLLFGFF